MVVAWSEAALASDGGAAALARIPARATVMTSNKRLQKLEWSLGEVLEGLAGGRSWRRGELTAAAAMAGQWSAGACREKRGVVFIGGRGRGGFWRASPRSKEGKGRVDGPTGEVPMAMAAGSSQGIDEVATRR
jgi:hypothetical protein